MLSVVIPAFNEDAVIRSTVEQVRGALETAGYVDPEIIVVDDGSTDQTADFAADTGATVISHPSNVGYGRSLKTGINKAKHDTIVIVDADDTYPIDEVGLLLETYEKGFDLVIGARSGKEFDGSVWQKYPLRLLLKLLVQMACGRRVPDVNSGFRIFGKSTITEYFPHLCDTFSFTTSMTLAYIMTGRFVKHIPISYHARNGVSKVRFFSDSIRTLQYLIQVVTYYNPLKMFSFVSILCFFSCFVSAVFWVFDPDFLEMYIFSLAMLMLGIAVFAMGLLAVLLKQIMDGDGYR